MITIKGTNIDTAHYQYCTRNLKSW